MEEKEAAYQKRGVPRIVSINWNELYYKKKLLILNLDSFIQNISNDGENFYNLMFEIKEKISDSNENVMESLRKIFIEKKRKWFRW